MSEYQVMVDLETLSTRSTAKILSIGAVKFCVESDKIISSLKINVDPKTCINCHVDPETVEWWKQQSKEARDSWKSNPQPIEDALNLFCDWYGNKSLKTWGYGANFDIPILENLFNLTKKKIPWKYYDVLCARTVFNLAKMPLVRSAEYNGIHHNSVDDATSQAVHLMKILRG